MANNDDDKLRKQLEDVQSYAILTEEIGSGRAPRPTSPGSPAAPGSSPLGQIVDGALREVLGWRPRATDAQGFMAALNQSFSVKEVEGHVEWMWTPRTYAVAAEMGAVTGAQASIYTRAKAMLDQSMPLLNGISPLRPDFDLEDSEAIRAIVRSSLTELVGELGREGGPRISRADELFNLLLGSNHNLRDTENVEGQLGMLRDRFGLRRQFVNTIGEEQNLTNFLILVDNSNSLRQTWESQRHFFDLKGTDVFLGTQLVLLSRALTVVSESVEETYFAMDSVFLGQAERQVTELRFDTDVFEKPLPFKPIFVGDLLSWIERFASEEGPRLIREGGKDGVIAAFSPTVVKLRQLSEATERISKSDSNNPTRAFHTARVQRALTELTSQLREVEKLATQVRRLPAPQPIVVSPENISDDNRAVIRLMIEGRNFQPGIAGTRVKLDQQGKGGKEIWGTQVIVASESMLNATFDLLNRDAAPVDSYTIVVFNPDGGSGSLDKAFRIDPSDDNNSESRGANTSPGGDRSRRPKASAIAQTDT
jgi:hypothetical protein